MNEQFEALRLADELDGLPADDFFEALGDAAAAELRRLHELVCELLGALKIAKQFMVISADWNIYEAEIDGEMRFTNDLLKIVQNAIAKATGENQ